MSEDNRINTDEFQNTPDDVTEAIKQITTHYRQGANKGDEDLEKRFTYHAPKNDQLHRYHVIRSMLKEVAYNIKRMTPPSREQSLALTHLEDACMWANAAIARNE